MTKDSALSHWHLKSYLHFD